ncbi:hypothetical protein QYF36_016908 [Acer negundo]|nr:hypothetical protein QYF36_016908 [Acer negundo]
MLLCDDQHVPEVYVNDVEKISADPGHVCVPTVQPIYQTFLQQLAAQFPSVGGSNNVLGSIPTTYPSFDITLIPIIPEDQTIDEVVTEPYNEDDRSIPEYNPQSEYGLDDFNEDYIGRSGSREGVNDKSDSHHGMVSDRSLKPKEIMTDMQVEHGLGLNYTKAWKAKEHAENNVFGPLDMSYQLLPAYCHELKCVNPDTSAISFWPQLQSTFFTIVVSAFLQINTPQLQSSTCYGIFGLLDTPIVNILPRGFSLLLEKKPHLFITLGSSRRSGITCLKRSKGFFFFLVAVESNIPM